MKKINANFYIVKDTVAFGSSYNSHILVKANNKKEALEKMWSVLGYNNQDRDIERGFEPHYKSEFKVTRLDDWFEKTGTGDVAVIH